MVQPSQLINNGNRVYVRYPSVLYAGGFAYGSPPINIQNQRLFISIQPNPPYIAGSNQLDVSGLDGYSVYGFRFNMAYTVIISDSVLDTKMVDVRRIVLERSTQPFRIGQFQFGQVHDGRQTVVPLKTLGNSITLPLGFEAVVALGNAPNDPIGTGPFIFENVEVNLELEIDGVK